MIDLSSPDPPLPPIVLDLECRTPASAAEIVFGIPRMLMLAIAEVESAADPLVLGGERPLGDPTPTAARYGATVAKLTARLEQGERVDVGCWQISTAYHGGAFVDVHALLDPVNQASFAAGYLLRLKSRHGSWTEAVAHYHGASDPSRRDAYVCKVAVRWAALLEKRSPARCD